MKASQREILSNNYINRDKVNFQMQTRTPTEELENRGAEQQYRISFKHHSESIELQNQVQKLNESTAKGNSSK